MKYTNSKIQRGFITGVNVRKLYLVILVALLTACSDFVAVDLPNNRLASETVFEDAATAESALKDIFAKMRDNGLLSKGGLNTHMGLYADALELHRTGAELAYQDHSLQANDATALVWWNAAYNQIYAANDLIEGMAQSGGLTPEDSDQFKGEALFVRAYLYLLLVELYGDIPYTTGTDYIVNTTLTRTAKAVIYQHIITDLKEAINLLPEEDNIGEKIRPYKAVAEAVLARAYLYTEDWTLAEATSTRVIDKFGDLEPDLNNVFLKDATGTIWQFAPNFDGDTAEGSTFIFTFAFGTPFNYSLNQNLLDAFEANDKRRIDWVGEVPNSQNNPDPEFWYHAFKYKVQLISSHTGSLEYSVQLRLAEQYLIRSEARAHLNDIPGAQADLNRIRNRAGLGNTSAATLNTLLDAILQERRVEFFTEKGHRWFDLKRMGKDKEILSPIKPGWRDTDILLPIPEQELSLNPNLLPQNDGY